MTLSDDQRKRMEENRLKALAKLRQKQTLQQCGGSGLDTQSANVAGETTVTMKSTTIGASSPSPPPTTLEVSNSLSASSSMTVLVASINSEPSVYEAYRTGQIDSAAAANNRRGVAATRADLLLGTQTASCSSKSSRVGGAGSGGSRQVGVPRTGAGSKFSLTAGAANDPSSAAPTAAKECEGCAGAEGELRVDQELLQGFSVTVCRACKLSREEYQCITKKEAKDTYLLPEGTIAVLKFIERDNPHHSSWTKMKLYLRKEVMAYSVRRWGSEAALEAERARREALKFDRSLARTKGVFKRAKTGLDDRRHYGVDDADDDD